MLDSIKVAAAAMLGKNLQEAPVWSVESMDRKEPIDQNDSDMQIFFFLTFPLRIDFQY